MVYWLATVQQAMQGNKEALEELQVEDKLRGEQNLPTVKEELIAWANRNKEGERPGMGQAEQSKE